MARQITIRGVSDEVARKLREQAEQRGCSVNALVLELLGQAVGMTERRRRLQRYAGSSSAEADALDEAIALQRTVDAADWS
jgi:plasmid stability protein